MNKALIIGIDDYKNNPLNGCVKDAQNISQLLERNGDGSPNFSCVELLSSRLDVTTSTITVAAEDLFSGDAQIALFYFAGHGLINDKTQSGYLVTQDGARGSWGLSIEELLRMANAAYPRIRSTIIILDSCQSGFAGEIAAIGNTQVSIIGTGVTILTASHRDGAASETGDGGLFTNILIDGLSGAASDICGRITPASLYSHVDQTLGPWEQRPLYKANVQNFIALRQVEPKIPMAILRRLPEYFPDPSFIFKLDPSFEPDRENVPAHLREAPVNDDNARIFKELQLCNRHGLVIPVDAEHMYYAAINSTGCRLTASGAHYRRLAEMKRL